MKAKLTIHELFELKRAIRYCIAGHNSGIDGITPQVRKYSGAPYHIHPRAVMRLVFVNVPEATLVDLIVALFHDLVEDTLITEAMIRRDWGDDIADGVMDLTDVSKPEDGNRKFRKTMDLEHTKTAEVRNKNIKICDLMHNANDITRNDKDFARVFLHEKHKLLTQALFDADPALLQKAFDLLKRCQLEVVKASLR